MSAQPSRQWGVTPAISTALPNDPEAKLNDELLEELRQQNNFEAPEETKKRELVLGQLQKITEEFVRQVLRSKGLSESAVDGAGGKIFTFGSYRLGVYGPGSDIDAIMVVPKGVRREDFFERAPALLQQMSEPGAVEECTPVPDSYVPIIKLEYSGVSVDLIFTSLARSSVPADLDLKDSLLLRGLDEVNQRSINGPRVTDEILALVPQTKTFRHALRAVKLWAQRRAIYANVMGFPGGVAWAMMVARICQLYPMAAGSVIVNKFFHLMKTWPWPRPVILRDIEDGPLQARVWNPAIYPGDRKHLMPIITPAYPSMCATHNITYSTQKIIIRELDRAHEILQLIFTGKKQWKDLFVKHTFFSQGYKNYMSIVSASRTKEAQSLWSGLVQSKVRKLVLGIEGSDAQVEVAHPFNKGFDRVHRCKTEEEVEKVLQGSLAFQVSDIKTETTDQKHDIKQEVAAEGAGDNLEMPKTNGQETDSEGFTTVYTTTFYVGIELRPGERSLDISYPVGDFKRQCMDSPQYNEDINSIRIVHVKNTDLPDDVFEPGETRPTKAKKSKSSKGAQQLPKKRTYGESGIQTPSTSSSAAQSTATYHIQDETPIDGPKRRASMNGVAAVAAVS